MPRPNKGESEQNFVNRCVVDPEAMRDFPGVGQRLAFCYSQYERYKKPINKNFIESWQRAYEDQRDKAEAKNIASVRRFYNQEYAKGISQFVENNNIQLLGLFKEDDLNKLYQQVYVDTGLHFANWYARNFDKLATKGINPSQYKNVWQTNFAKYAASVAATNVSLVQETARKTLIQVTTKLLRDPDFMLLGAREQARILRSQFDGYSKYQAERFIRTETTRISNLAVRDAATTVYGKDQLLKRWSVVLDGRERLAHREMAGKDPIPFEEDFIVGGDPMAEPGDGSRTSAKNVVNCRCSVVYIPREEAETTGFTDIGFGLGGQDIPRNTIAEQVGVAIASTQATRNYSEFKARNRTEAIKIANKLGVKNADFSDLDIKVINEYLLGLVKIKERFKGFELTGYGTRSGLRKMIKDHAWLNLMQQSKELRDLVEQYGEKAIRKQMDNVVINSFKYKNPSTGRWVKTLVERQGVYASRIGFGEAGFNIKGKIYKIDFSEFTGIYHNAKNYKKFDPLVRSLDEMIDVRWSSLSDNPIQHLVMHEAGHQIDYAIDFVNSKEFDAIFKKYDKGVDFITENLSEYGAKNKQEFIAEAFAEYITSNNPRPIAVEIGEAMSRLWQPELKRFIKPVDSGNTSFFFNLPQTEPKYYNKIKALFL